jgi:hypothetical protein
VFDGKTCFILNEGEVASKIIDGEAILINLSNGVYYSLDTTGAVIWEHLASGHSFDTMFNVLLARYDIGAEQLKADLERIISELCNEKLIFVHPDATPSSETTKYAGQSTGSAKEPYVSPKLHIYNDMGDLLALDPPMPKLSSVPWSE